MTSRILSTEKQHVVEVGKVRFGGSRPVMIAGPCSVESHAQIIETARALSAIGVDMLRGGAFKPRTSPYAFQGLGEEGLRFLREAADLTGLPVVSELMDAKDIDLICRYADLIQIGSRNMHNYSLLKAVGQLDKPVLLKRGMSATIREWIMAAEYIAHQGNQQIILCERGIRTFETATRNTLDLSAVPIMKRETGLPVIVDPSHGTGRRDLVEPMALAALAAGADGLMIEVHPAPEKALSDGPQSLTFEKFRELMENLRPFIAAAGRTI